MSHHVKLVWITPEVEKVIAYCARVSNPANQDNENIAGLIKYCAKHGHWSVFEMASACIEIETSRAISAQILRHRSFSFQEFSQRYAESVDIIGYAARRQDNKNRQNSFDDLPWEINEWFQIEQLSLHQNAMHLYKEALSKGIAKECARMILPMATQTRLYMSGTIRSWIHYLKLRCDPSTQKEHRDIAESIKDTLLPYLSTINDILEHSSENRPS